MNEFSNINVKQIDPFDWIISNFPWPKSVTNAIPPAQRLLRLKIYNNYLLNSARSSASSDDSDIAQNTVIDAVNDSNSNQQLVNIY